VVCGARSRRKPLAHTDVLWGLYSQNDCEVSRALPAAGSFQPSLLTPEGEDYGTVEYFTPLKTGKVILVRKMQIKCYASN
jgi:hypothetical protein